MPPINNARIDPAAITFNGMDMTPGMLRDLQRGIGLSPELVRAMDIRPAKKESTYAKKNKEYLNNLKLNLVKNKKSRSSSSDYFREPVEWSTSVHGDFATRGTNVVNDSEVSPF